MTTYTYTVSSAYSAPAVWAACTVLAAWFVLLASGVPARLRMQLAARLRRLAVRS